MTRGQKIRYRVLLLFNRALGLLPTWFLYGPLLWFLYFVLYRVARYRVRTVRENLRGAFPEKPRRELRRIERQFYLHLSEIFLDAVDMVSIGEKEARGRVVFEDVDGHEARVAGRDWIAAMAHYGSWEYFSVYQFHTASQVAGVYKPVHDKAFDAFYRYSRSRFGLEPVSMKVLMRYILNKKAEGRRIAVGMIADQSARPNEHTMWFDFLGRKTIFYAGIERLAVRFGMPVYFTETRKVGRTRYVSRFVEIYDGREQLPEGEITYRYAKKLEENILRAPQYWIWSHKRWKHTFGPGSRYYRPGTGAVVAGEPGGGLSGEYSGSAAGGETVVLVTQSAGETGGEKIAGGTAGKAGCGDIAGHLLKPAGEPGGGLCGESSGSAAHGVFAVHVNQSTDGPDAGPPRETVGEHGTVICEPVVFTAAEPAGEPGGGPDVDPAGGPDVEPAGEPDTGPPREITGKYHAGILDHSCRTADRSNAEVNPNNITNIPSETQPETQPEFIQDKSGITPAYIDATVRDGAGLPVGEYLTVPLPVPEKRGADG
ncbi:MAG: lysophospholipid acyltransferase family protein [Alistipes sp.]|nr:lysophospholipid acyltransferase family protein [Alistipes sp.]